MIRKEGSAVISDCLYADMAFVNGRIITVNENNDIVEAVAIKGNRIIFTGTSRQSEMFIGKKTKVIDLKGRSLMPGINDSHFHPILNGMIGAEPDAAILDTGFQRAGTVRELLDIIRTAARNRAKGEWISAMGYEAALLEEKRHPTLDELDEAYASGPLQIITCNGHNAVYNHAALRYLRIFSAEDAARFPEGEVCVKDGRLTGEVRGHTHFTLWSRVNYDESQQEMAALKSQQICLENGITSIGDMGECGASSYHIMQKLCREGKFKVRVYMALHSIFGKQFSLRDNENWFNLGLLTGLGDAHFRIGPCKFMIDGGSGEPTCFTRKPYSHDPSVACEKGWSREEVYRYIRYIDSRGCQCTAHAMGDGAVEYMVEGYEKAFNACADQEVFKARRHRIEHCMLVDPDLIERMAKMNICPSVNAGLQIRNGKNLARFFGPEREKYLGALRSMLDAGIRCSLHSDAPSGPIGFEMIAGAVNRYDRRQNYQCSREQAVSLLEAIRCCTVHAAYQSGEEESKGSIETGKLADFIVLDRNILTVDPMELCDVKVDMTMIDGRIEYVRSG